MLSPHFSLREFTRSALASRHGIANAPSPHAIANMQRLCRVILEPLRANVGRIDVTSGYRSPALNSLARGSASSQHITGEAVDIECPTLSTADLAGVIAAMGLPFDQLILEFVDDSDPRAGWVHVSHKATGNRGQVLRATMHNGRVAYEVVA